MSKKYKDKDWLKRQYSELGRGAPQIANQCGVTNTTIYDWLDRHEIETRGRDGANTHRFGTSKSKHNDEDWLKEKYISENMTASAISDICGVHKSTIIAAIERYDIQKKSRSESAKAAIRNANGRNNNNWNEYVPFALGSSGYETWQHRYEKERQTVMVHRLLAVSEYGIDALDGMEVHHKSNIPFDNRPDNIELLTPEEHSSLHRKREITHSVETESIV